MPRSAFPGYRSLPFEDHVQLGDDLLAARGQVPDGQELAPVWSFVNQRASGPIREARDAYDDRLRLLRGRSGWGMTALPRGSAVRHVGAWTMHNSRHDRTVGVA